MTAQILDGTATAAAIKAELTQRVAALAARGVTHVLWDRRRDWGIPWPDRSPPHQHVWRHEAALP